MEDIAGDRDKEQEVPTEILLKQAETFGFKQHPYQRTKRMTGERACWITENYGTANTCGIEAARGDPDK